MGKQEDHNALDRIATVGRNNGLDRVFVVCDESGEGWLLVGPPRRLTKAELDAFIGLLVERVAEAEHIRAPGFTTEGRRRLLGALGVLCLRSSDPHSMVACPECQERAALRAVLRGETLDEAMKAKVA